MRSGTRSRTRARCPGVALAALAALITLPLAHAPAVAATQAACNPADAAQGRPATASSAENSGTSASAAFDGATSTRWSSQFSDPQWIQVDLGATEDLCSIDLNWETAYGKDFQLQASADGQNWTTLKT
ncbi:discoidin domain-containing protein, partial [Streptomyces broussonetiae]